MDVTGLGWCGTRTSRDEELARFYQDVPGLQLTHTEPGFWVFLLPDGRNVEVFGPGYPAKTTSAPRQGISASAGGRAAAACRRFPPGTR
jgi:hypothetical protein